MGPLTFAGFILLISFQMISSDQEIYKMCAYPNYDTSLCQGLEAGKSQVSCIQVTDSAECTLLMKNGSVDFGLFQAEQAVLASRLANDFLKVIGEIRYSKMINESYGFRAVVVVPANFSGSFSDLKGKNYCHPGFDSSHSFTDRVLKYFERKVVNMPCYKSVSAAEQEVAQVSDFFKAACRPGAWAQEYYMDNGLKRAYPNLCQLCNSEDCKYNTDVMGAFEATLDCLTKRGGDVAYTSYKRVRQYFGLERGYSANADASAYKLLCTDQSLRDLSADQPCTWFRQPWPLLIVRKELGAELQGKIISWLDPNSVTPTGNIWLRPLQKLLLSSNSVALNISLPKSLSSYIDRGVDEDTTESSCRDSIKFCTVTFEEKTKCDALKNAASTHGMIPRLECVPSQNIYNCMHHIKNGGADIMSLDTEYGYIARTVYNLSTVVYEDGSHKTHYQIIAVIKSSDNQINGLKTLRNKKMCFPEYRGLGWSSYVYMLRKEKLIKPSKNPEDFLGPSCTPGAKDPQHNANPTDRQNILCQLCPTSNSSGDPCAIHQDPLDPSLSNSFYGDLGAMSCLMTAGDVAVVDYMRLLTGKRNGLDENIDPNNFRVLCRNGSLSAIPGLDVDDDCALSVGIKGEVVGRKNRNGVDGRDSTELLLNMDNWFGSLGQSSEGVLRMFGRFNSHSDSLFEEGTVSLVPKNDMNFPLVERYATLMSGVSDDIPSTPSSSTLLLPSLFCFILSLLISL